MSFIKPINSWLNISQKAGIAYILLGIFFTVLGIFIYEGYQNNLLKILFVLIFLFLVSSTVLYYIGFSLLAKRLNSRLLFVASIVFILGKIIFELDSLLLIFPNFVYNVPHIYIRIMLGVISIFFGLGIFSLRKIFLGKAKVIGIFFLMVGVCYIFGLIMSLAIGALFLLEIYSISFLYLASQKGAFENRTKKR